MLPSYLRVLLVLLFSLTLAAQESGQEKAEKSEDTSKENGQKAEEKTPTIPAEKRQLINMQVTQRLEKDLKRLIDEEQIAKLYGLELPVPKPDKTIKEVEETIAERVEQQAYEKYPRTKVNEFTMEAREKYQTADIGEVITLRFKDDRKPVEGHLRAINEYTVTVERQDFHFRELTEETLALFFEARTNKLRNEYIDRKLKEWNEQREEYREGIVEDVTKQVYREAGYRKIGGRWISEKDFFEQKLAERREELRKRLQPKLQQAVYRQHGYTMHDGELMTAAQADKRRKQGEFDDSEIHRKLDTLLQDQYQQPGETAGGSNNIFQ